MSREYLPGQPAAKLIRAVRKQLGGYGIRPQPRLWRLAWEWAQMIRNSYFTPTWPLPTEIATQYVVLLLADMRDDRALKLPFRAGTHAPPAVLAALGPAPLALPTAPTPPG